MIRGNFALDPGRQQLWVTGGGAAADLKLKIKRVCTVSIGYYNLLLQSLHLLLLLLPFFVFECCTDIGHGS